MYVQKEKRGFDVRPWYVNPPRQYKGPLWFWDKTEKLQSFLEKAVDLYRSKTYGGDKL